MKKTINRVVHGSPFWLLFDSFLIHFFTYFSRMRCENESKMKSKRRLFAKWATPPPFCKPSPFPSLFDFIFHLIFNAQFKLRFPLSCHCTTRHRDTPCSSPLPPDSANHHNNDQRSRQQPTNTTCNHLQPPATLPRCHP